MMNLSIYNFSMPTINSTINFKFNSHSQPRIHTIRSDSFRERFQLDLVDMRHNPSFFSSMQYLM